MTRADFIGTHAHSLMPNCDVLHLDAVTVDARPSAADARCAHNANTVGRVLSRLGVH